MLVLASNFKVYIGSSLKRNCCPDEHFTLHVWLFKCLLMTYDIYFLIPANNYQKQLLNSQHFRRKLCAQILLFVLNYSGDPQSESCSCMVKTGWASPACFDVSSFMLYIKCCCFM